MLNGLDLFSGIGGISLALKPWVRTVCYVEIEPYCQAVLQARIRDGNLCDAPIWDDVTTFDPAPWAGRVDIIFGGFPCVDISLAGKGAGLEGERSGLFWEIIRCAGEIRPAFIFLENVPAITERGGNEVVGALAALGYDCRWGVLSAYDVGAPHQRERWWCLAADTGGARLEEQSRENSVRQKCQKPAVSPLLETWHQRALEAFRSGSFYGIPRRMDRIKGLGNAVVPQTAREAFARLMGC